MSAEQSAAEGTANGLAEPEFLDLNTVFIGDSIRHKPSGLIGRIVSKSNNFWANGQRISAADDIFVTLALPKGAEVTFMREFVEALSAGDPNG